LTVRRWTPEVAEKLTDMTDKTKTHSVDFIRAIKDYLRLRTSHDDLSPQAQVHLSYLAFLVKADGTSSVGYAELERLRLSSKTIAKNNKDFQKLGLISKVDKGYSNQFGKAGKVSKFHFSLPTILRLNEEVAVFPLGKVSNPRKSGQVPSFRGRAAVFPEASADFPKPSADFPVAQEPLSAMERLPEVLFPDKNLLPEETIPERSIPDYIGGGESEKSGRVVTAGSLNSCLVVLADQCPCGSNNITTTNSGNRLCMACGEFVVGVSQ
jgi:hypothetical protein